MPSQNAAISGGDRNESWDESVNQSLEQKNCILLSDCNFKQTFSGFGFWKVEIFCSFLLHFAVILISGGGHVVFILEIVKG